MKREYVLENDFTLVKINALGAELSSFVLKEDGTEYLWQGNPRFWGRRAPILFPIVGRLKDNTYKFAGQSYTMTQHGFARDLPFELVDQQRDRCSLKLVSNEDTLKKYPFEFELVIAYELTKTTLVISYEVKNTQDEVMYFSIGAHPGFNWPLSPTGAKDEDYVVEFSQRETADLLLIDGGLISKKRQRFLTDQASILLSGDLFKQDALVFQDLKSDTVSLKDMKTGKFVKMEIAGFPYLGIWSASESAPFICFEPWFGIADQVGTDQELTTKLGIQRLAGKESWACTYSITVG